MFCFPNEQTAGSKNVCGQKADIAELQDKLTGALIGLARATEGNDHMISDSTAGVIVEGLLATQTNVNFDNEALLAMMAQVDAEKRKLVPACYKCACACGRNNDYDMRNLHNADEEIRALKSRILLGIRGVADCVFHAGYKGEAIHKFLYKALFAIGRDDWGVEELQPIVEELDEVKRKCMALPELLDGEVQPAKKI